MTAPEAKPLLGLMLGDMTGIGPEISARLLARGTLKDVARIAVIGDARVFELGCRDAGVQPAWRAWSSASCVMCSSVAPARRPDSAEISRRVILAGSTLPRSTTGISSRLQSIASTLDQARQAG